MRTSIAIRRIIIMEGEMRTRIIMRMRRKRWRSWIVMRVTIVMFLIYVDSLSEKKVRKNNKKSDIRKNQIHNTGVNSKEIKYPTRNKTRQLEN
jgi:hypothetical protein